VRAPFAWWWPALAVGWTALAIVYSANYAVAVPAAFAAVVFAGVAVGDAARRTLPMPAARPRGRPIPSSGVRDWIRAGRLGREDLLLALDRLDRRTLHPDLPSRTPEELRRIAALPRAQFYGYVARRLDALEGSA